MILRVLTLLWDGIAPALKNHLWQSTFFLLLAALLALALRRNHAHARYWLWLAASVKFLVPFSLLVALGSHIHLPHRPAPAQAGIYVAMDEFSQPFTPGFAPVAAAAAPPTKPAPDLAQLLPRVLATVWFAGFAIILCVWAVYWRRVSAAVRHAVPIGEGRELATLRRLERAAGVRRGMEMRLVFPRQTDEADLTPRLRSGQASGTQAGVMEPGIFGIARPVLVWPKGISERLDAAHLEAILAHEVCHVRRRDNLTAAMHMLVEAIFWFHPLVWWLGARLVEERERACDEEVLRLCNRPEVYAEGILKVCEFCLESPLPCVSGVTGSDLKKRIANVLAAHVTLRLGLGKKVLLAVAALMVIAAPIVLGQAKAARRMMLAAVNAAPKPLRAWAAAHAMIAEEQTPSTGLIPEAQAAAPTTGDQELGPEFEVATIRPSSPDPVMMRWQPTPDGLIVNAQSLKTLITYAYGILPEYVFGGPDWAGSQQFDINAKFGEKKMETLAKLLPKQRGEQAQAMLRTLLAERFKLKVRRETKESAIYELMVAKGGPKLTESPPLVAGPDGRVPPEWGGSTGYPDGRLVMKRTSMLMFATTLSRDPGVAREVVDATGMKGPYDFEYTWKPSQDSSGPSLFTALQEQLGLKLVASKGPIETLVIDHAEQPSVDGAEVPDASLKPVAMVQEKGAQAVAYPSQAGGSVAAQPAQRDYRFEVASIRATAQTSPQQKPQFDAGLYRAEAAPLGYFVGEAFGIKHGYQIQGPSWMGEERFTLNATPPAGATKEDVPVMLRHLLEDRFALKYHYVTRRMAGYELVVVKPSPGLAKSAGPATRTSGSPVEIGKDGEPHLVAGGGTNELWSGTGAGLKVDWRVRNETMAQIASRLADFNKLNAPVVDATGLDGAYDFEILFAPEIASDAGEASMPMDHPLLRDALQEQLGLALRPVKNLPVDVLVIDSANKQPTEN